jgi:hypothetical protein
MGLLVEEFSPNGKMCLNRLCQPRGQAHFDARVLRASSCVGAAAGKIDRQPQTLEEHGQTLTKKCV